MLYSSMQYVTLELLWVYIDIHCLLLSAYVLLLSAFCLIAYMFHYSPLTFVQLECSWVSLLFTAYWTDDQTTPDNLAVIISL
jgi:hypothetical protein